MKGGRKGGGGGEVDLTRQVQVKRDDRAQSVAGLEFGVFSGREMVRNSHLWVTRPELYTVPERLPAPFGPLDTFLGESKKREAVGRFGHISLALPVFHVGFFRETVTVLQCVCKRCSRVLLDGFAREAMERQLSRRQVQADALKRDALRRRLVEACRKITTCPHCHAINGPVRRVPNAPSLRIIHDLPKIAPHLTSASRTRGAWEEGEEDGEFDEEEKEEERRGEKRVSFASPPSSSSTSTSAPHYVAPFSLPPAFRSAPDPAEAWGRLAGVEDVPGEVGFVVEEMGLLKSKGKGGDGGLSNPGKSAQIISPLTAYEIFRNIPDADCHLLWFDPTRSRPESLILTHVQVPPVCIRPSVPLENGGSNEDDLTSALVQILKYNEALEKAISKGAHARSVHDTWDMLQLEVAAMVNGELPGFPQAVRPSKRPSRGLCQRLKGKQGRFRGNLSGKRVDFSARSVISPDPNLPLHAVGVPLHIAMTLTFPERVTEENIERLRAAVRNGPYRYPGANLVRGAGTPVISLQYGDRKIAAGKLRVGDTVDRHMIHGDIVLFNRQPSLHKMSIMSHRVRVHSHRTLRFNECVCAPYNADFDGDEMNLHLPQTEEARAEASLLMEVRENLVTPRSAEALVSATQDFLTASFLLTQPDVFFHRDEFCQLLASFSCAEEPAHVPPPAILLPVPLWTGKQVISALFAPAAIVMDTPTSPTAGPSVSVAPTFGADPRVLAAAALRRTSGKEARDTVDDVSEGKRGRSRSVRLRSVSTASSVSPHLRPLPPPPLPPTATPSTMATTDGGLDGPVLVTTEFAARNYSGTRDTTSRFAPGGDDGASYGPKHGEQWGALCPAGGYVVIREGELLAGNLDKNALGDKREGLVFALIRDHGPNVAAACLLRLTRMVTRWLTDHGFSVGIEDVMVDSDITEEKYSMCGDAYDKCTEKISELQRGQLELLPGCDEDQSLESHLNGILSRLRDSVGKMVHDALPRSNSMRVMASCGSKGSTLNICQMTACVGQQSVNGARVPEGFVERTLPIFRIRSKDPDAKGFVANSFLSGLSATEFFFHTMGGRQGLVDTAVKTAETGYMQRRMMKALEDLSAQYDGTVRSSASDIVQFEYGDDGLDPTFMEEGSNPFSLRRVLASVRADLPMHHSAPPTTSPALLSREFSVPSGTSGFSAGSLPSSASSREGGAISGPPPLSPPTPTPSSAPADHAPLSRKCARRVLQSMLSKQLWRTFACGSWTESNEVVDVLGLCEEAAREELRVENEEKERSAASRISRATIDAERASGKVIGDKAVANKNFVALIAAFVDGLVTAFEDRRAALGVPVIPDESDDDEEDEIITSSSSSSSAASSSSSSSSSASSSSSSSALFPSGGPVVASRRCVRAWELGYGCCSSGSLVEVGGGEDLLGDVGYAGRLVSELTRQEDGISAAQLREFLERVGFRLRRAIVHPGEAVGAVAAHSMGEPATQMTLKTFHFAGVASMNVTLGVPRIKEIMNASKAISTPVMIAKLESRHSEVSARFVRGRVECTFLKDIASSISTVNMHLDTPFLLIEVDMEAVDRLKLSLTLSGICHRIRSHKKLKNLVGEVTQARRKGRHFICVTPTSDPKAVDKEVKAMLRRRSTGAGASSLVPATARQALDSCLDPRHMAREMFAQVVLERTRSLLLDLVLCGLEKVKRAVVSIDEDSKEEEKKGGGEGGEEGGPYHLVVEGEGFLELLGTVGVDWKRSVTNHVKEVEDVLGIEAARLTIMSELDKTYDSYGIGIDRRHLMLLADVMTYRGEVLGITRFGIAKMKDSVLMLASFEKTPDHLFEAAVHARVDNIRGVSESIVVGRPCSLGTGAFALKHDVHAAASLSVQRRHEIAKRPETDLLRASSSASAVSPPLAPATEPPPTSPHRKGVTIDAHASEVANARAERRRTAFDEELLDVGLCTNLPFHISGGRDRVSVIGSKT